LNPSFDSGLAFWTVNNNLSPWFPDSFGHFGNNNIESICGGSGCLSPVTGAFFYQDLPTVAGATYNLSFWAFFEQGTPAEINEIKVTWGGVTALDIVNPPVPDDTYFNTQPPTCWPRPTLRGLSFSAAKTPTFKV
jgi:hypothetical protein